MLAGLRSQRPMRPRPDGIGKSCRAVCNGLPCSRGYLGRLSPYGQGGPSSDRHTKVVLGPCHYRAIHSGHDRSRADNHGQRHGALDLRRSPNLAGDGLPQSGFEAGDRWSRCIRLTVPDRPIRPLPHIGEPLLNGQECPGHSPFTSTAWAGGLGRRRLRIPPPAPVLWAELGP
jgi:hypothetical protein